MKLTAIHKSSDSKTQIVVEPGALARAGEFIRRLQPSQAVVLTNATVRKLYYKELARSLISAGQRIAPPIIVPDGERSKSIRIFAYCQKKLLKRKIDRDGLLIALGGGVITDLGGMTAACYKRGIKLVLIPTTLLGQADASIGGKSALNHQLAKNSVGCFYHPELVLVDPLVLSTLSRREFLNGLVEILKISLVSNRGLLDFAVSNSTAVLRGNKNTLLRLIISAIQSKLAITQKDPLEKGPRNILNFGHTLGHALETRGNYARLSHGEAVALGMLVSLKLSLDLGLCREQLLRKVGEIYPEFGLPQKIRRVDSGELWKTMQLDKKARFRRVNFVLLEKVGWPRVLPVNYSEFKSALEEIL